jgi:hypothetical protein
MFSASHPPTASRRRKARERFSCSFGQGAGKNPRQVRFSVCSSRIFGLRTPVQKKMTGEKSRLAGGLRRFQAVKSARLKRLF